MEIIRYTTEDFVMTIESHEIVALFDRASRKINNIQNSTKYLIYGPTGRLEIWRPEIVNLSPTLPGMETHPVIFENADYIFDVEFIGKVRYPRVFSRLKEITDKFYDKQRGEIHTLTGTVNYGNDIGSYDFVLRYEKNGVNKEFILSFEVFPTKLDFKRDYRRIIDDIENEYSNLVLDFLRKTYTNFNLDSSKGNDLVWWSIFGSVYQKLLKSTRFILNKPHTRLIKIERNCKADQLKQITPALEEQLVLNKHIFQKLYRTSNKQLTLDTTENRFLKFAIATVCRKFNKIKQFIENKRRDVISKEFKEELNRIEKDFRNVQYAPFFRSIGAFKGMPQESLVLQKKTGYAEIYKSWIFLKSGFRFFDGIQKINLKDIADLYQIWCFLKMKGMIQLILGKNPDEVDLADVQVDNFLFTLKKGKASRVLFISLSGERIELYHDYTYSYNPKSENLSFTVDQRPDIVLKISKSDLEDNYTFTYLYDAKYRLKSDDRDSEPDYPPNDAINQMHRYRDSIYYQDKGLSKKGKEVVGGYILFPGSGTIEEVKSKSFYKSIRDVNIGAFPLVPNDSFQSQMILQDHLSEVIHAHSGSILHDVIPQKGMVYEDSDAYVLAGFLRGDSQKEYFKSGTALIYHMPVFNKNTGKINTIRNLGKLKYFCPIIGGVDEYYLIEEIKVLQRKDIFPKDQPNGLFRNTDESYYVFILTNRRVLKEKIRTDSGGNHLFRYARLSELRKVHSINEFNKISQEVN